MSKDVTFGTVLQQKKHFARSSFFFVNCSKVSVRVVFEYVGLRTMFLFFSGFSNSKTRENMSDLFGKQLRKKTARAKEKVTRFLLTI